LFVICNNSERFIIENGISNSIVNTFTLATMFNVLEKIIKRTFCVLSDLKDVKYVGINKAGHWEIRQKGEKIIL